MNKVTIPEESSTISKEAKALLSGIRDDLFNESEERLSVGETLDWTLTKSNRFLIEDRSEADTKVISSLIKLILLEVNTTTDDEALEDIKFFVPSVLILASLGNGPGKLTQGARVVYCSTASKCEPIESTIVQIISEPCAKHALKDLPLIVLDKTCDSKVIEALPSEVSVCREVEISHYWNNEEDEVREADCRIGIYDESRPDIDCFFWFLNEKEISGDVGDFTVVGWREVD